MIEAVLFFLMTLLWPVALIITVILSVISFFLPYIVAVAGAAVALGMIGTAICGLITGTPWQRLKIFIGIIGFGVMFAAPFFIHHRGWDALAALLALLAAFIYVQCVIEW